MPLAALAPAIEAALEESLFIKSIIDTYIAAIIEL
jgi:hypothetical protein